MNHPKLYKLDWFESSDLETGLKLMQNQPDIFLVEGFKETKQFGQVLFWKHQILKIYGGDSGYDNPFSKIGKSMEKLDLAI